MKGRRGELAVEILDGLSGIIFAAWIFMPLTSIPLAEALWFPIPGLFLPLYALQRSLADHSSLAWSISLFGAYLVPLYGLAKLITLFVGKRVGALRNPTGILSSSLRIIASSFMVLCFARPLLAYGDRFEFYLALPWIGYAFTAFAMLANVFSVVMLIRQINLKDPVYCEYQKFKYTGYMGARPETSGKRKMAMGLVEVFLRIRAKLFIAFIGILSVTLVVLIGILLNNYRDTILKAIGDGAKVQSEQAASIYKVNLGDDLAMFEYMNRLQLLNEKAEFRFDSFSLYSNRKQDVMLESLAFGGAPDFPAEFSTLSPNVKFPALPPLSGTLAAAYGGVKGSVMIQDTERKTLVYLAPILTPVLRGEGESRVRKERLLGFARIEFREQEIYEPFFRTRANVIALTLLFGYLSIILVYIIGNFIVNPLLFLSMSVRKISDTLRSMMRGEARVSAQNLNYIDYVNSRDEIKALSGEIGDMVTVIRGIIPYISASTLKQAEKGEASSVAKELTFLFTDIRGFTTLCEGLAPNEVVDILNHFLDLETEIILANGGDVDKFVGDEMMAVFDGPEKEVNACKAAIQISLAMMEEKEKREKEGKPTVTIGIGINTGSVVFGSVGARDRMDFTSIGDTVNLAARLEGANKAYHSKVIISYAVYKKIKSHFLCRELDYIAVKGKDEAVRIYEILQEKSKASPKIKQIASIFESGLEEYRKGNWKVAATFFKQNMELYQDGPSQVFLERVKHFIASPPPKDWDGVFRMTVK